MVKFQISQREMVMSEEKPTEDELREMRRDAQHNVADAHAAFCGDIEALQRWRKAKKGASLN